MYKYTHTVHGVKEAAATWEKRDSKTTRSQTSGTPRCNQVLCFKKIWQRYSEWNLVSSSSAIYVQRIEIILTREREREPTNVYTVHSHNWRTGLLFRKTPQGLVPLSLRNFFPSFFGQTRGFPSQRESFHADQATPCTLITSRYTRNMAHKAKFNEIHTGLFLVFFETPNFVYFLTWPAKVTQFAKHHATLEGHHTLCLSFLHPQHKNVRLWELDYSI